MGLTPEQDQALMRQARMVALVIAGTGTLWVIGQWLGKKLGIAGEYAILLDLSALAAFFWALVVTFQIWRKRRAK
jgi:hypothetical protein